MGGSAAGVVTGSSGFLTSDGADSVGGAEIKALIWKKGWKPLRYLELYEAETSHTEPKTNLPTQVGLVEGWATLLLQQAERERRISAMT